MKIAPEYLPLEKIGARFSRSQRWGQRFVDSGAIDIYLISGKKYVKIADLEAYEQSQKVEHCARQQPRDLKTMLRSISARVLRERRAS